MRFQKLYIASLPRSGSTLLTRLLDQLEDVLCLPESFFPAALSRVTAAEWQDSRRIAALFVVSCSDGSPLTVDEAEKCIRDDKEATLDALASAVAVKAGRDLSKIRIVVWKFTRLVGSSAFAAQTGGRFLVLRRNPLNVFESQFRVHFGAKNRHPARFAFFESSYLAAFKGYPADRTRHMEYGDIGSKMDDLIQWMGSSGARSESGGSGVAELSAKNPWHSEINKPFQNRDHEKIANLSASQVSGYESARAMFARLPWLGSLSRKLADHRQMKVLWDLAEGVLNPTPVK
ncbi:sulfotransferase [Luteolibacter flavescens]|uniref:Sulfotransferase n=1 Tax=Luteolibacter flavescens TaxID=1859460 RepID=A0ABT3FNK5_9BACT|nr:sulfotransferase [Luteolibacter flavescens]MCW1885158.1 sulfotransferase [Luteolibacter flavescens]